MIGKLKNECGHQFTSKLEGMFKDMALSSDSSVQFREELTKREGGVQNAIDFSVLVLSAGVWPSSIHYQEEKQVRLPAEMLDMRNEFLKYYMAKHDGRTVFWNYALGTCEVKVTGFVEEGTHEFTVSPLQAVAMRAFNKDKTKLTFQQLLETTGIPREDLKRHMISMAVPKFQVFVKTGLKREFLDEDIYEFNSQYKSKLRKVKIPLVSMSGGSSGSSSQRNGDDLDPSVVPDAVTEARRHLMEASIVRVMKSRKRMDHNNLVAEVLKHLKFKPTPQELKKRIEALIERDYLERDEKDMRYYLYMA
jgi:cullin 3